MKIKFILWTIIFIAILCPTISHAAPSTTLSITPSATDGTTITASDENTRNNAVTTWANAHDHNDIDQATNTLAVGDAAAGNKTIQANNADVSKPFIRYNDTTNVWELSPDGSTIQRIVVLTGSTPSHYTLPETMTNNQIIEYNSSQNRLVSDSPNYMADDDQNTLIQLEESANENIIRMDTNGTERWIMTAAGERTMPTQPAFLVTNIGIQSNIATGGVTVILDDEIFDQSNDFATNTFTAPVTGRYILSATIGFSNMDQATTYQLRIVTSNRTYNIDFDPRQFAADPASAINLSFSVLADMDSTDTVTLNAYQDGGTAQTDIPIGSAYFSGYLAI